MNLLSAHDYLSIVIDNRTCSDYSGRITGNSAMIWNRFSYNATPPHKYVVSNGYARHNHSAAADNAIASNIRIKPHGVTFQQTAGKIMCENHCFQPHTCIVPNMDALGMRTVQDSPPGDVAILPDMTASHPMILCGKRVQESGNSLSK